MRHIDHLYEQVVLLRQRHFGASTEQSAGQAHLFDEAELLAAASTAEQDQAPIPSQSDAAANAGKKSAGKAARGKRAPLPFDRPRVDIVHEVPEAEPLCPCGTPMVEIGEDVSEQLDIENAIRPFVVGRKRWLFADTPAGAHASAVIYSLIETARANGLEPYTWLRRVMRELPAAQSVEAIEALLPWKLHRQNLASEMTPEQSGVGGSLTLGRLKIRSGLSISRPTYESHCGLS
jgi:IS66 C-terminal element/Transposase C of IS166 homeodomain/Transposase IS66 family